MGRRFQKWIAGRISYSTDNAVLFECLSTQCRFWVPKFAIAHVRNACSQNGMIGVVLLSIDKNFDNLKEFKALKPDEVQSLLNGSTVQSAD